jgi:Spy/CpxP family protein refolding chaperone
MKRNLALSLVALAVAGTALAAALADPFGPRPVAAERPAAREAGRGSAEELAALREEVRTLRARLAELERDGMSPRRRPVAHESESSRAEAESAGPPDARAVEADASSDGEADTLDAFRLEVAAALADVRERQAAAELRAIDERIRGLDARMPELEERLELTPDQSARLRSALTAKLDREADVVRRWGAGEAPEVLSELRRGDRAVHESELAEILGAAQLEVWASLPGP